MTAREKADELVDKFIEGQVVKDGRLDVSHEKPYSMAIQCAIIAVDEILRVLSGFAWTPTFDYYTEVKNELNSRL